MGCSDWLYSLFYLWGVCFVGGVFVRCGVLCFCPKFVFALCVCCLVGCLSGCHVLFVWDVVCMSDVICLWLYCLFGCMFDLFWL